MRVPNALCKGLINSSQYHNEKLPQQQMVYTANVFLRDNIIKYSVRNHIN